MASIHIANLHATPLLVSLPPLQAACTFWGLALLADLHCSVSIVWVGQHCAMLASCLATSILLLILINVHSSFLATFASQPELWGLALRAGLHCSVGVIVWVPTLLPCWHHCLPHPLLVSLINVCASFLATSASNLNCGNRCCVPICIAASALFGLTNIAAMMASWDMACQHSLCWCALLLPRIAWLPTSGACCSLGIAVQIALANLLPASLPSLHVE